MSAIATAVLFSAANSIWALEQPDRGASGAELVAFHRDLSTQIEVGALLSLTSIATFAVFAGALRSVLVELEGDELLANVAFGGTLLGLAAGVGAESINMAGGLRAADGTLTEALALALFDVSYVLGSVAAAVGIGLLLLATGGAALRTGALLPRWVAVAALVFGGALVTPLSVLFAQYTVAPGILLLLILGVLLLGGSAVRVTPARSTA